MKIKALLTTLCLLCGLQSYGQQADAEENFQRSTLSFPFHKAPPRREIRHLINKDGSLKTANNPVSRASGDYILEDAEGFPTTGEIKAVVILAQFKDIKFSVSSDSIRTLLRRRYNDDHYTEEVYFEGESDIYGPISIEYTIPGSARDYFRDQSFGQFVPSFEVIGPVTLSQNRSYYGANNNSGNDKNVPSMIREACQKAYESGTDFTNYDNDGDNVADIVYVVYAGCDEAQTGLTDAVWAQAYELSTPLTLGDAKVSRYACSGELVMDIPLVAGIGTFVHEFSHILGLPDFYNTKDNSSNKLSMDYWSIMDSGNYIADGFAPCGYTSFERYSLGWIPMETLKDSSTVIIGTTNEKGKGYRIFTSDNDTTSFYVIENICQEGWNSYVPGEGLLISQVTYNRSKWESNEVNTENAYRHYVVAANNNSHFNTQDYNPWEHLFGTANHEFTLNSIPASITQFGVAMDKPLTDIMYDDETGKTTFKISGGEPEIPEDPDNTTGGEPEIPEDPDNTTGSIEEAATDNGQQTTDFYDLMGRRVENPSKGIYIQNGVKVVIK